MRVRTGMLCLQALVAVYVVIVPCIKVAVRKFIGENCLKPYMQHNSLQLPAAVCCLHATAGGDYQASWQETMPGKPVTVLFNNITTLQIPLRLDPSSESKKSGSLTCNR